MDAPTPPSLCQRMTRYLVLCSNVMLIVTGASLLLFIAFVYCLPITFNLMHSIQHLINAHAFMIFTGILCVSMVVLGSVGMRFIKMDANLFLGLQVFALLFVLVLEAALFYAFLSHWRTDIEIGVIFAVQLFKPSSSEKPTMAGIQVALRCCGRGSFEDYYVANEAIVKGYVPHSCCDTSRYNSSVCREVAGLPAKKSVTPLSSAEPESHRHAWLVPNQYAFPVGCNPQIRSILVPVALAILCSIAGTIAMAVFVESVYLHLTHEDDSQGEDHPMNGQSAQIPPQASDQYLQVPQCS